MYDMFLIEYLSLILVKTVFQLYVFFSFLDHVEYTAN